MSRTWRGSSGLTTPSTPIAAAMPSRRIDRHERRYRLRLQRSTYVVRLVLTQKDVGFRFHDTETEMHTPEHLARHPFGRVPALQHGDFVLYETERDRRLHR